MVNQQLITGGNATVVMNLLHMQVILGKLNQNLKVRKIGRLYFIIDNILCVQIDIHRDKITSAMQQINKT